MTRHTSSPPERSVDRARATLSDWWWRFFDWLAIVSWKTLLLLSLLLLIVSGMLQLGGFGFFIIMVSFMVKILAGGKQRADIAARDAAARADLERLERRVAEAELAAMQAQIEPHFLFNTLASVEQLIETDPPLAARVQHSLIQYLRAAMPQMREPSSRSTLGQQLALSRSYLDIMQVRMEERLQVGIDSPEGLSSAEFPPMMLQTLVENAIKHGLEPKAAGGSITIAATVAHGQLRVSVTDSGAGLSDMPGNGIGLANVRERLKLLYGQQASLIIDTAPDGGTTAVIELPYRSTRN